ncbi:MAG: class I lanthipeptide [Spirosomataceae bacterium]
MKKQVSTLSLKTDKIVSLSKNAIQDIRGRGIVVDQKDNSKKC